MTFGTIFDIKRFALHDGDGLRTTLFLKGCPLNCPWCQNPEGIDGKIRLRWFSSRCIRCGLCIESCPMSALSRIPPKLDIEIDHGSCEQSAVCIDTCPANALSFDGSRVSAEEVAGTLLKDKDFFQASGGGITLSGGEPLAQPDFAYAILERCRQDGVETAVETTLAVDSEIVRRFPAVTDHFLVDLKLADKTFHQKWLGPGYDNIRLNLEYLLTNDANVTVRIPLIPGFTATEDNLTKLGNYIVELKPSPPPVELVNFNPLAENKYRTLHRNWPIKPNIEPFRHDELEQFTNYLYQCGLKRIDIA